MVRRMGPTTLRRAEAPARVHVRTLGPVRAMSEEPPPSPPY